MNINELKAVWDTLFPDTPVPVRQVTVWTMQHKLEIIKTAFFQLAKKVTRLESVGETMNATDRQGYATSVMNRATEDATRGAARGSVVHVNEFEVESNPPAPVADRRTRES